MALQQPRASLQLSQRRESLEAPTASAALPSAKSGSEGSQEWILFSPNQVEVEPGHAHDEGGPLTSESISFAATSTKSVENQVDRASIEDGELDSLDEHLQDFQDPSPIHPRSINPYASVLPAHDGLGVFARSSQPVRTLGPTGDQAGGSYEGLDETQDKATSVLTDYHGLQISQEKKERIEKWRLEQSRTFLDGLGREIGRRKGTAQAKGRTEDNQTSSPPKPQGDYTEAQATDGSAPNGESADEPMWKRLARRFVRDVIGIDEPLLSVIVGETLPEDIYPLTSVVAGEEVSPNRPLTSPDLPPGETWPDRLIYRIARELGFLVNTLSPQLPPSDNAPMGNDLHYAGIPIQDDVRVAKMSSDVAPTSCESLTSPTFSPTLRDPLIRLSLSSEDDAAHGEGSGEGMMTISERLHEEREYWERELDIRIIFRFLRGRESIPPDTPPRHPSAHEMDSGERVEAIRRHHPLVAGNTPLRASKARKLKRPASNCRAESFQGERRLSQVRARDGILKHWDIGASPTNSLLGMG